jgi:hypothetical protein
MFAYIFLPGSDLPSFSAFTGEAPIDDSSKLSKPSQQKKTSQRRQSIPRRLSLWRQKSYQFGLTDAEKIPMIKSSIERRPSLNKQTSFQSMKQRKQSKQRRRCIPKPNNLHLIARCRVRMPFKASLSFVEEDGVSLEATLKHANQKDSIDDNRKM